MIEYMADNNEMLIQILQTLNNFQLQTTAAFSEVRAEIKKSREIENEHWQENLRRWDENDKRWEENDRCWAENDKRWEENKKLWEENKKLWKENEINRKNDKKTIDVINSMSQCNFWYCNSKKARTTYSNSLFFISNVPL